jgi:hypothetical protein
MKKVVKLGIQAKGSYAHIVMGCTKGNENACGRNWRNGQ